MKKDYLLRAFFILYILFALYMLGSFWNAESTFRSCAYYTLIIIGILILLWKTKEKNISISNRMFSIGILIGILLHIGLLFLSYKNPASDYAVFYRNAVSFSKGELLDKQYVAIFPHLSGYIFLLGSLMKLFTTKYFIVIVVNIVFNFIGAFLVYQIFAKQKQQELGKIGSLLWILSPLNLIWCTACIPIIIFQTCFLATIFLFERMLRNQKEKKKYFCYTVLCGIMAGIANLYRPIMIIFIIAVVLYGCYLLLQDHKKWKLYIGGILVLFVSYYCVGKIHTTFLNAATGYQTISTPGWTIYVGSTGRVGTWTPELGAEFQELTTNADFDLKQFHKEQLNKAILNYKNRTIFENGKFLKSKFDWLTTRLDQLSLDLLVAQVKGFPISSTNIIKFLISLWIAFCLMASLGAVIKQKIVKNEMLLFYSLLCIGITLSHLLTEISPRYLIPIYVPLILMSISFWKQEERK